MDLQDKKLQIVRDYIKLRWQGPDHAVMLTNLFSSDGCVIDVEGLEHRGFGNLVSYYSQPTPTATEVKEPVILKDGRIMLEFSIVKYLMTWNLKAYFEFTTKNSHLQLYRVTMERPGFFS
jgi:hypothetical protein